MAKAESPEKFHLRLMLALLAKYRLQSWRSLV
jgi:hypothetical protein